MKDLLIKDVIILLYCSDYYWLLLYSLKMSTKSMDDYHSKILKFLHQMLLKFSFCFFIWMFLMLFISCISCKFFDSSSGFSCSFCNFSFASYTSWFQFCLCIWVYFLHFHLTLPIHRTYISCKWRGILLLPSSICIFSVVSCMKNISWFSSYTFPCTLELKFSK